MACWWVSDRLILVDPDDSRCGQDVHSPYSHVDHEIAAFRVRDGVGSSKASVKFEPENHGVDIDVDPRTGKYGCPRINTIKISARPGPDPKRTPVVWARKGETAWARLRPFKEPAMDKSMEKLVHVVRDAMGEGKFSFSRIPACVAPMLAEALVEANVGVLRITSTKFTEEVAAMVAHVLTNCQALECLELMSCDFSCASFDSFRQVANSMKRSKLRGLHFCSRSVKGSLALKLLIEEGLVGHPTLEDLHFSGHEFHSLDTGALRKLLTDENCNVEKLHMVHCTDAETTTEVLETLEGGGAVYFAAAVADALTANETVAALDMSGCNLSDNDMESLACMLTDNCVVEELLLEGSGISEEGIIAFASKLHNMARLRKLDLKQNQCGSKACEALRHGLEKGNVALFVLEFQMGSFWGPCCTPPHYFYSCEEECRRAIECHLAVNKGSRALLRGSGSAGSSVPPSLWSRVLGKAQTEGEYSKDITFHLLKAQAVAFAS